MRLALNLHVGRCPVCVCVCFLYRVTRGIRPRPPFTRPLGVYLLRRARYFGAKNGQGAFLRVDLEQVSFGSLLGEEGRL